MKPEKDILYMLKGLDQSRKDTWSTLLERTWRPAGRGTQPSLLMRIPEASWGSWRRKDWQKISWYVMHSCMLASGRHHHEKQRTIRRRGLCLLNNFKSVNPVWTAERMNHDWLRPRLSFFLSFFFRLSKDRWIARWRY
jgi:hypothetical protein